MIRLRCWFGTIVGKAEYQWRPDIAGGTADPDGPPASSNVDAHPDSKFTLPPASIAVLRGKVTLRPTR